MAASSGTDRVRLYILFHRKEGMSFEDFDRYWTEVHPKVALSIPIFRRNILTYEQIHTLPSSMSTLVHESAGGFTPSDYDGIVVLEASSERKITEVFSDPEYLERLAPDEEKFSERASFRVLSVRSVKVLVQDEKEAEAEERVQVNQS